MRSMLNQHRRGFQRTGCTRKQAKRWALDSMEREGYPPKKKRSQ